MDAFLDTLATEFSTPAGPDGTVIALRLLGAAILSAVIGIEREVRSQPAGLRTNMLVGIASATFAIAGLTLLAEYGEGSGAVRIDPLRLIEAVTGGVAFLAAGLIVFSRGKVHGLTTGAGMWLAAAAGFSVGVGQWFLAVLAAIGGLLVLALLRLLEKAVGLRESGETPSGRSGAGRD